MKTKLVQIGKSKGVVIPAAFIKLAKLRGALEIVMRDDEIAIRSTTHPRAHWEEAFEKARLRYGDKIFELTKEDHEWLDAHLLDDSGLGPW